ncbi:MAG: hypothetical protein M3Q64_01540, partial [bacterium]|nr:hypothetical protein [bacterium]
VDTMTAAMTNAFSAPQAAPPKPTSPPIVQTDPKPISKLEPLPIAVQKVEQNNSDSNVIQPGEVLKL